MTDHSTTTEGIHRPESGVVHRGEEYDPAGFAVLQEMQKRHFWYRGRHRFIRKGLQRALQNTGKSLADQRCIDLGGGCGGWLLDMEHHHLRGREMALSDSSLDALQSLPESTRNLFDRYQIDLLQLQWENRWDVAFLLDVLEHIPEQEQALREIYKALAPGGLLLITTPALQRFWTYNDDLVHHVRRYSVADMQKLAPECGFELLDSRYFMWLLSPLLLVSRWGRQVDVSKLTEAEKEQLLHKTHQTPAWPVNEILAAIFSLETPLGHMLRFPWGTSIFSVLRKPL